MSIGRIVDAFSNHIESAVENAIIKKLNEGISKIGTLLQSLPTQVKVDETSALDVTFVRNPTFGDSSIGFVINGLFIPMNESLSTPYRLQVSQSSIQSHNPAKMIAIALHEDVFNSGSLVYFNVSPFCCGCFPACSSWDLPSHLLDPIVG
jgi:lipopolysaccharide-binding protein